MSLNKRSKRQTLDIEGYEIDDPYRMIRNSDLALSLMNL